MRLSKSYNRIHTFAGASLVAYFSQIKWNILSDTNKPIRFDSERSHLTAFLPTTVDKVSAWS